MEFDMSEETAVKTTLREVLLSLEHADLVGVSLKHHKLDRVHPPHDAAEAELDGSWRVEPASYT